MMRFIFIFFMMPTMLFAQDLKIVSWNVYMLPKPIKFSLQPDRTKLIGDIFEKSDYDFIFFQEAFSSKFRSTVGKRIKNKYPHQYVLPRSRRITHVMNSGVYVASKKPFEILGHYYYTKCASADCFAAKGVLLIEQKTESGKKVQFAITHMQAGKNENKVNIRRSQIKEIKALLDKHARPGVPQFLVGDLNIDAHLPIEYPESIKTLEMSNTPLVGTMNSTNGFKVSCYNVPGEENAGEWLDHVWLRENRSEAHVTTKKVIPYYGKINGKDCPLSDHYAVEALIHL